MEATSLDIKEANSYKRSLFINRLHNFVRFSIRNTYLRSSSVGTYTESLLDLCNSGCLCHETKISEIEYLVNKSEDPEWEFRCLRCTALEILEPQCIGGYIQFDTLKPLHASHLASQWQWPCPRSIVDMIMNSKLNNYQMRINSFSDLRSAEMHVKGIIHGASAR